MARLRTEAGNSNEATVAPRDDGEAVESVEKLVEVTVAADGNEEAEGADEAEEGQAEGDDLAALEAMLAEEAALCL